MLPSWRAAEVVDLTGRDPAFIDGTSAIAIEHELYVAHTEDCEQSSRNILRLTEDQADDEHVSGIQKLLKLQLTVKTTIFP